jgi:hypothetical protein
MHRLLFFAATLGWTFVPLHGAQPNDYAKPENWLCRPGRSDACSSVLTATVIAADGSRSQRTYKAVQDAPVDCFYVYPTISRQQSANSDMAVEPEEERAAKLQFARFGEVCRLYAPMYRQVTLAGLRRDFVGDDGKSSSALAYDDVLAAWRSYLARDNKSRGVVLIGHSQGARILKHLIAAEIDGKPEQAKLVSAILPGTDVEVPKGKQVGDDFRHIPLCAGQKQTGCIVAYSTYLASKPPGDDAVFSGSSHAGSVDACVNPAALAGDGKLEAELPAVGEAARMFGTTFMENPGLLSAKCIESAGHSYLAISVGEGAGSGAVGAGLTRAQASLPGWGLHVLDVNLALGNLVDLVGAQAKAWASTSK